MGEVKTRWTVTYTKHLKQKRKVYHDGTLHLLSNNKVMLYDEAEELLDSRFLTKDEIVKSGESLPFASFLVDIDDLVTNPNITSCPNPKSECDIRSKEKTKLSNGQKLNTLHCKRKLSASRRKTSAINISPSQKIIREFKKNELLRYEVQQTQSSPSATTSSFAEWEALYTTQIAQKAKKYHDGFLRVITCGSQGRQIMMYDSSRNQLSKRFLKRDEIISSGETLTFDGYLVDIGDRMGIKEDNTDVKINGRNCAITEKMDTFTGQKIHKSSAGKPQHIAYPSNRVNSNFSCLGVEKMKPGKMLPSHVPVRDANQILSILRKPVTTDKSPIVEEAPIKQDVSQSSELPQLDSNHPSGMVVEKYKDEKLENEGYIKEGPVCTQQTEEVKSGAFESPSKSQLLVGSSLIDRLQASATDHGISVILDSSQGLQGSLSPAGTHSHQMQPPPSQLSETDPESEAGAGSTSDMSKPICSPKDHNIGLNVKIDKPSKIFDCPSFDLGFGF